MPEYDVTQLPIWFRTLATTSVVLASLCALAVVADIVSGRRQRMAVMNAVWPLTALWAGPFGLWAYWRAGRRRARGAAGSEPDEKAGAERPLWRTAALGATHCGAGCTLADAVAEWGTLLWPVTLFGHRLFGTWLADYVLALFFGIGFQYFSIKPMRQLSPPAALRESLKADTLSLTAWQVGMYGWMAMVTFVLFGAAVPKTSTVFWFMMQLAMAAGFVTSWPVNAWLIRRGTKPAM